MNAVYTVLVNFLEKASHNASDLIKGDFYPFEEHLLEKDCVMKNKTILSRGLHRRF